MRRQTLLAPLTALVLAAGLTACGSGDDSSTGPQSPAESRPAQDTATPAPTEEADEPTNEPTPEESSSPEASESPDDTGLAVTVGGERTTLDLTDVYCDGSPGDLRHAVGKTHNAPPLVKVEDDGFVMVKLQRQGPPEKADSPEGVTIGDESVTFDDTRVGEAVLSGTMTCTAWDD